MANNVSNTIEIRYDKTNEEMNAFCKKVQETYENNRPLTDIFDTYIEETCNTRIWWEDNIGAKWAYFEDSYYDPGLLEFHIQSAWGEVRPLVEYISSMLNNECSIMHTYIDEMPNFAGCYVLVEGEMVYEFDDQDLTETLNEEAQVRMNEQNIEFETEDEFYDWMWDWKWDYVHDLIEPEENLMDR